MPLTPIKDWCSHYALFVNDAGFQVGKKKIKAKEPVFDYDGRKFNFFPDNCTVYKVKGTFRTKKYYQYNINDPNPLWIKETIKPEIDSKTHKGLYDQRLVHELCNLSDNIFMQFLKKYWWLILIIVVVIWFFASGHTIGGLLGNSPPSPTPNVTAIKVYTGGAPQ